MKRATLVTLSILSLATVLTTPALALNERFQDARDATLNQVKRDDDIRDTVIINLTDRFDRSYRDNLDT